MMNPITPETPVGEIARVAPSTIPTLLRLGIDFCCNGRDSLSQATARASRDLAEVIDALKSGLHSGPTSTGGMVDESMTALCEHIVFVHHARARELLDRATALADKVAAAHAAREPRWTEVTSVLAGLRDEMLDHMVREERVLFPWLKRLENSEAVTIGPPWSVKRPIDCMLHDHDAVATALARLRALTDDYRAPAGACGAVEALVNTLAALDADTRVHIHKENNILFPQGIAAEKRRGERHITETTPTDSVPC